MFNLKVWERIWDKKMIQWKRRWESVDFDSSQVHQLAKEAGNFLHETFKESVHLTKCLHETVSPKELEYFNLALKAHELTYVVSVKYADRLIPLICSEAVRLAPELIYFHPSPSVKDCLETFKKQPNLALGTENGVIALANEEVFQLLYQRNEIGKVWGIKYSDEFDLARLSNHNLKEIVISSEIREIWEAGLAATSSECRWVMAEVEEKLSFLDEAAEIFSPQEWAKWIWENPSNLFIFPNNPKSYRLCRCAIQLDPKTKYASPYHALEILEQR